MENDLSEQSAQYFARLVLASLVAFLVLQASLILLRPDLPASLHMISEYGVGPHAWFGSLSFLALALSYFAIAAALRNQTVTLAGRLARIVLCLAGLGAAMGGIFAMDALQSPQPPQSFSSQMHGVGFMIGTPVAMLGISLTTFVLIRQENSASVRVSLIFAALHSWAALVAFAVAMAGMLRAGATPPYPIGIQNRLLVVSWVIWLAVVAVQTLTGSRRAAPV